MNINTTSNTQAPAPLHKAGGTSVRTREADAEQDAGSGAGFLAMLHALTEPVAEAASSAGQATADANPSEPVDTTVPDDSMANALQAAPLMAPAPTDMAGPQRHADGALAPGAHRFDQRAAQGHGAADLQSDAQALASASGDAQTGADALAAGKLVARKSHMALSDSNDKTLQLARAAAQAVDNTGAQADQGHAAKESDQSMLRPLVPAQASASVVSMFEAGLAGLRAGPGARGLERGQDRHAPAHAATGFVAWTDSASTSTSHQSASAVYAPTASTPVPAAALAQRMHYWVAGGVQSAELQLDAFGGGSVDVRIAVKGDEAMVAFRSDQPQARQLLLDAMPQLKELLAGEGLVLSGGFVGGSAQDPAHGRGNSPDRSPAVDRASGGRDRPALTPVIAAVRASPAGAIDLFV